MLSYQALSHYAILFALFLHEGEFLICGYKFIFSD